MPAQDMADARWEAVDELLFAGSRLQALAQLQGSFDLDLHAAIESLGERFDHLREHREAEFRVPVSGFWDGFYT